MHVVWTFRQTFDGFLFYFSCACLLFFIVLNNFLHSSMCFSFYIFIVHAYFLLVDWSPEILLYFFLFEILLIANWSNQKIVLSFCCVSPFLRDNGSYFCHKMQKKYFESTIYLDSYQLKLINGAVFLVGLKIFCWTNCYLLLCCYFVVEFTFLFGVLKMQNICFSYVSFDLILSLVWFQVLFGFPIQIMFPVFRFCFFCCFMFCYNLPIFLYWKIGSLWPVFFNFVCFS